ncbi:hypothetical protein [Shewanella sp. HN-41]|uniref:hypothetical protein n=1 Tax=Shewanella sp. HN-41 TaxID=327275 RepID=UPI0002125F2C|nr:hypothetical protein [Shewanella sp. HN-41]EGM69347.1 hypothetical protein SOHN41_02684 [Shewanella sp. HN-41]
MQQDNMNKSGLAVEQTVKAAWSKPEIEEINIAGYTEGKATGTNESFLSAPS